MGFYVLKFTVPANTPEESPLEEKLPITGGILHQVTVTIPPGHAGLTGVAIDHGLHQIAPTNQNEWFRGDDVPYSYPEYIELSPDTRELVLRGFNLDDTNDHSFVIAVGIMPAEIYNAVIGLREDLQPMISATAAMWNIFKPPGSQVQ